MLVLPMTLTRAQDGTSEATRDTSAVGTIIPDDVTTTGPIIINDLPDSTGSPTAPDSPIYYLVVVVLALLLVGAMVFSAHITKFIATMVPPETASSIYQSGVRFGLQMALNQARQTPMTADDDFFKDLARQRGLEVSLLPDGTYEVKYVPPAPTPAAG